MDITQTTGSTAQTATPPATSSKSEISSDFETFLKMLTVQMQNQDPLNPVDSSDYAVQLATFSGVEQQVQTNDLLRDLSAVMGAGGMAQMAGWVGMEARTSAPVQYTGSPVTLLTPTASSADAAELVVRDSYGDEIARYQVDPRDAEVDWVGVGSDGSPLPAGQYAFEVVSYALGEEIAREAASTYARVTEVQSNAGQTMLVLQSGATVPVTSVTAVREPAGS